MIDSKVLKWIEYVDESTMGTTPTDPTMVAFPGEIIDFSPSSVAEFDEYPILKGASDSDPLSSGKAVKSGETHDMSVTIKPSAMSMLPYALLGATSTTFAPGTTPHYVSLGMIVGSKYAVMSGCPIKSITTEFPDKKTAAIQTIEFLGAERVDWGATDFIGTGSHGTAPGTSPFTMADLSNVLYDGSAPSASNIMIDSLKFTIDNAVEPVIDLASSFASKVGDYQYGQRGIDLELGVSLLDVDVLDDVLGGAAHTFAFTLDGKTYTFSDVKWVNQPDTKMSPADALGMSLQSSSGATRLAIA